MSDESKLRITLGDLPAVETLSPEEQAEVFGAGKPRVARLGIENLETREVMSATPIYIDGTAGNDTIVVELNHGFITKTVNHHASTQYVGPSRDITIRGGDGKDTIVIKGGTDNVAGTFSSITVLGGAGKDVIDASGLEGTQALKLWGEAGDDKVIGGAGDDQVSGGEGDDVIDGGGGRNTLVESTRMDELKLSDKVLEGWEYKQYSDYRKLIDHEKDSLKNIQAARIIGDSEANEISATDFSGDTEIRGFGGDDIIYGGKGRNLLDGSSGNDYIQGSARSTRFTAARATTGSSEG